MASCAWLAHLCISRFVELASRPASSVHMLLRCGTGHWTPTVLGRQLGATASLPFLSGRSFLCAASPASTVLLVGISGRLWFLLEHRLHSEPQWDGGLQQST